jgi:Phage tail tube protein, TTP
MAVVQKWANVQVAIQSALGAAKTITAITKANPGVVSSTAHGFANGDYVLLASQGMFQLDGRVFRVAGQTANTFQLEGEDTTLYDTFSSGSAYLITFGTTMSTATGLTASGGEFDFIDTTTIHQNVRSQIPGLASAASYTFENLWDPSDAALIAMKYASDNQLQRAIRFTFSGQQKVLFNGYIGATLLPTGNAQDKVVTSAVVTMFGKPTLYVS